MFRLDSIDIDVRQDKINLRAKRRAGVVYLDCCIYKDWWPLASEWTKIGTLPVGWRPTDVVNAPMSGTGASGKAEVTTGGEIWVASEGGTINNWKFSVAFPV